MAHLKNWIFPVDHLTSQLSSRALASPPVRHAFCLAISILGVIFKFWLITQTEIQDADDDPHEYVLQILYPLNGGLAYPPGTGLVGRFLYESGIPFRLGIEALFIFAAALVLRALLAWPSRSYLSLGLFLLTILNPNPTELFSHLMSDQVWLVESMAGLSCLVLALEGGARPKWGYLGLSGFFLELTALTRSTFIPLMASLVFFFGISLVLVASKLGRPANRNRFVLLLFSGWSLLLGLSAVYFGTCFYDLKRHGYFGVSIIDNSEYKKFYTCLQSVGDAGNDTHFPVDEDRRRLIAQAGPVSRWFVGEIEKNAHYKQVGTDKYGKADIPAGWFHFATFNAVLPAAKGDLSKAFALLTTIENEIAEAHHRGLLKVRPILPLPDSRLHLVLAAFPDGLKSAAGAIVYQPSPDSFTWKNQSAKYESVEFSQAVTRRIVTEGPMQEKIWRILCAAYSLIYTLPLFYLFLGILAIFPVIVALKWSQFEEIPLLFLAQQSFLVFFMMHLFWYALFDASGLYIFTRYMVYQNVMLPILIAYYVVVITRLLKTNPP